MDKNTFLAVVLSGAIMVIWYAVFPPPEPPPGEFADNIEQIDKTQSKEFKKEDSTLSATSTLTSIAEVDSSLPSKEAVQMIWVFPNLIKHEPSAFLMLFLTISRGLISKFFLFFLVI